MSHLSWDYVGATLSWAHAHAGQITAVGSFAITETEPVERIRALRAALATVPAADTIVIAYKPHGFGAKTPPPVWPHLIAMYYVNHVITMISPAARSRVCVRTGLEYATVLASDTAAAAERARARGVAPPSGVAAAARKKHAQLNALAALELCDPPVRATPITYGAITQLLLYV